MKLMTMFLLAGLGLAGAAVVPPAAATPTSVQDEDVDPIEELKTRVTRLEQEKAGLEARLQANEELISKAYAWMKTLPAAATALQGKVEQARKDGFEKAGPNPRSKKAVLDGLIDFGKAFHSANPAAPTARDDRSNRRRR